MTNENQQKTDLPKFESVENCPKCKTERSILYNGTIEKYKPKIYGMDEIEYMRITCGHCDHFWKELCADHE